MKKTTTFFVMIPLLMIASLGQLRAQTFSDNTSYDIQNGNGTTDLTCGTADELDLTIAVTGVGTLGTTNQFANVTIDITHTWVSDVDIFLLAPDGTTQVELTTDNGGSGDDYTNTVFIPSGPPITGGSPPFTGNFSPEGDLSVLNGLNADGNWTLEVCDDSNGDTGTVNSWSITFEPVPTCPAPTGLTASNITNTTADLSWTLGGSEGLWDLELVDLTGGGSATGTPTNAGLNATTFNATGLTEGNNYEFYVRADCTGGDLSSWVGPFAFSTVSQGDTCSFSIPITVEADCATATPVALDFGSAPGQEGNATCDGIGDFGYWYNFVAPVGGEVQLNIISGTGLGLEILDACAGTSQVCLNNSLDAGENELVTGLTPGNTYYMIIWRDTQSTTAEVCLGLPPSCPAPSALTATTITTNSATLGWTMGGTESAWDIELVDITGGGSATGTPTASGVTNPYNAMSLAVDNDYEFYVRADCTGGDLSIWTGPFAFSTLALPPANDDCANAVALTVNGDLNCTTTTAGTINGSTDSGVTSTCGGTDDDDVWYTFVATQTSHKIDLLNVAGNTTDLYHAVYDGACGTLDNTDILCSDPNGSTVTGLTPGNTYYLQVYSWGSTADRDTTFDVCIGTFPPPPANDLLAGAVALTVGSTACSSPVAGTNAGATDSGETPNPTCANYSGGDVWYSVEVPVTGELNIETFTAVAGTTIDTGVSVYSGTSGSLVQIECDDDDSTETTDGLSAMQLTGLTPGETLLIRVWEFGDDEAGGFQICAWSPTSLSAEDFSFSNFKYHPNPVNDNVLNLSAEKIISRVNVYNIVGQQVVDVKPEDTRYEVNLSNAKAGVYFVKVEIEGNTETFKVIKR